MALNYSQFSERMIVPNEYGSGDGPWLGYLKFENVSGITVTPKPNGIYCKVQVRNGPYDYHYKLTAWSWITDSDGLITGKKTRTIDEQTGTTTITDGYFRTNIATSAELIYGYRSYQFIRFDIYSSFYGFTTFVIDTNVSGMEVKDIALDSTITDGDIKVSWANAKQEAFLLKVLDSVGTVVYEHQEESTNATHIIPARTLSTDTYTVSLVSGCRYRLGGSFEPTDMHGNYAGAISATAKKTLSLSRIAPKILAFEPNGVAQNREQQIAVNWTSENQHGYTLKVKQNGATVKEYSGTTGTAVTIPANTLASGLTALELTLKYIPIWGTEVDAVYASQTINFQAYGTPPMPVITTADTMDTAFPKITWTASEQYTFRLKVLSGATILQDTGEVPSELPYYTLTKPLENGVYTLKLTVKNQYGIYSPEASKELTVSYVLPQKPIVYCSGNDEDGTISVKVFNADTGNFKHCDLFRKLDAEWSRVAKEQPANFEFIDHLVKPDTLYQYMARAIGKTSGYHDSDIKTAQAGIVSTQLFEPSKPNAPINLRLEPSREETAHRNVNFMVYAGMQAPTVEFGEEQYSTVAASFYARREDGERLKHLYNTATVLCYRDNRGRFLYGFISSDPIIKDEANANECKTDASNDRQSNEGSEPAMEQD